MPPKLMTIEEMTAFTCECNGVPIEGKAGQTEMGDQWGIVTFGQNVSYAFMLRLVSSSEPRGKRKPSPTFECPGALRWNLRTNNSIERFDPVGIDARGDAQAVFQKIVEKLTAKVTNKGQPQAV